PTHAPTSPLSLQNPPPTFAPGVLPPLQSAPALTSSHPRCTLSAHQIPIAPADSAAPLAVSSMSGFRKPALVPGACVLHGPASETCRRHGIARPLNNPGTLMPLAPQLRTCLLRHSETAKVCRAASLVVIPAGESPASIGVQSML